MASPAITILPLARSAEWTIAEHVRCAFEKHLNLNRCYIVFRPKFSLLADPERAGDDRVKFIGPSFLVLAKAENVKPQVRLQARRSKFIAICAVNVADVKKNTDLSPVASLARNLSLPYLEFGIDVEQAAIEFACKDVDWLKVQSFYGESRFMREIVNVWHYDLLTNLTERAAEFGLSCFAETAFDSIIDTKSAEFSKHIGSSVAVNSTLDIVLTTPGPFCIPLAVVHVDGRRHDEYDQLRRDRACDQTLVAAGLLIVRARLDNEESPSRKNGGLGDQEYWQRVADVATAVLWVARAASSELRLLDHVKRYLRSGIDDVSHHYRTWERISNGSWKNWIVGSTKCIHWPHKRSNAKM